MLRYEISGCTDRGLRRCNNEDAYLVCKHARVAVVADGMGGAAAGEVASSIFVEAAADVIGTEPPSSAEDALRLVKEAFRVASLRMLNHVAETPEHRGMGCTAEVLAFCGEDYLVGHVGDSRTYLFRNGNLRQITKDHSLVQQQLDSGVITQEQARTHRMKNVLLKVVAADLEVSFDVVRGKPYPGDIFLACSDGLTGMVEDIFIKTVLGSQLSLKKKIDALIDGANAAGGKDNVTVVLARVHA